MSFDLTPYKPFIAAVETLGMPILTPILTAAATGFAGPFGLAAPMVLNGIVAGANKVLGIDVNATPQQTAATIQADPDDAKAKLAEVQEGHAFLLAQAKQVGDVQVASQGQQQALLALDAQSQSLLQRAARPALIWGLGGVLLLSTVLPFVVWAVRVAGGDWPASPTMDVSAFGLLSALLAVAVVSKPVEVAARASAVKAVVAGARR